MRDITMADRILAAAFKENNIGSLENMEKVFKEKKGFQNLKDGERKDGFRVLGIACLILLKLDKAAQYFKQCEDLVMLTSVYRLAIRHGKYRLVKELMPLCGQAEPLDYQKFLREKALPSVPLFYSDEEGFSIDEEILNEIIVEIGEPREKILAETVRLMESAGSLNIVKKFILSYYSGDESLIAKYEKEFNKKARAGRQGIESIFKKWCQSNGYEFKTVLQKGDENNYFPTVANLFLVSQNGKLSVYKENLRLHQDYSSLSGYSMEKEILESVKHGNVVQYKGYVDVCGFEFLILDYMAGIPLDRFVSSDNLLSFAKTIEIIETLARVIKYLHSQDIICMDIKDKNVMWDGEKATYFDFGVSQIITSERRKLSEPFITSLLTTPEYSTPAEMALTFTAYRQTDIFQLGILFYRLLTGKNPFARYELYDFQEGDNYRESEIIKFALPAILNGIDEAPAVFKKYPAILNLISEILEKDFRKRPGLTRIIAELQKLKETL